MSVPVMASRIKVRMLSGVVMSPAMLMPTTIKTIASTRSQIRQTVMREKVTRNMLLTGCKMV